MKGIVFVMVWSLVFVAACYDGYFAWQNRAGFTNWEINPVARWVAYHFCVEAMVAVKGVGIVFAALVAFCCRRMRHRLEIPLTAFVTCCYLFLAIHYAVGFLSEPAPANEPAVASRLP